MNAQLPSSSDPTKGPIEFHLKEWEFLRTDIRAQVEQSKYLEFATITGLAAFYAWFISSTRQPPHVALWLPVVVVLLGALRSYGTWQNIRRQAQYVRQLEAQLSLNDGVLMGWDRTRDKMPNKSGELKASAALFWLATSVVAAMALVVL